MQQQVVIGQGVEATSWNIVSTIALMRSLSAENVVRMFGVMSALGTFTISRLVHVLFTCLAEVKRLAAVLARC
jgi:hypothetical protein